MEFCGDNAAMIAYRGLKLYENGIKFDLTANAFPSLPKIFLKLYNLISIFSDFSSFFS